MAYTTADLSQVRKAIVDLASGQRVTRVSHNGRTLEYGAADLDHLRSLEREIAADLQTGTPKRRTRYAVTSKGL